MSSVESWRRAALAAYVLAGAALASGGYALATTQANVNAIAAAQQRLSDDGWSQHQAQATADSARSAAGEGVELDARPYPAAADWAAVAGQVMPSVVMVPSSSAPRATAAVTGPGLSLAFKPTWQPDC